MLLSPRLAHLLQAQDTLAVASGAPADATSGRMNSTQFASETYPQVARSGAWRELLAQFGLRSDLPSDRIGTFAKAALRGDPDGMTLGRLTAASQTLSPIFRRGRLPIALLPLDEEIEIETDAGIVRVPPGTLAFVPLDSEWRIGLDKSVRLAALSISESLLHVRRPASLALPAPRHYVQDGLAAVLIKALEAAVAEMDRLSKAEWRALEQSLVELVLTVIAEAAASEPGSPSLAALFNRLALTIERRLHDLDLSAARVAHLEGISERYLQKLFELNGETFSHYLRERRLQRARAALTAPNDFRTPVADVAYACGFGDAANFNRLFKERFGLPPGAFRTRQAEKLLEGAGAEQRGWPVHALANPRNQQRGLPTGAASPCPEQTGSARGIASHHRLAVNSANVHWGYFSRSLRPVLELRSGDSVEVETLTQHASDAPDLMIRGDPAAEDVFFWTKDRKAVDRRGAGPLDASIFGRGAGEGFGVHICTGPIFVKDAEPGDVIEVRIDDIFARPSASPGYDGSIFRQHGRGLVGLSLRRAHRAAQAARARHDLRDFFRRRRGIRGSALRLRLGSAGRSIRSRSPHIRLPRRAGRHEPHRPARRPERRAHSLAAPFRRDRARPARGRSGRTRCRRPISAATSTTGVSARDPRSICPFP